MGLGGGAQGGARTSAGRKEGREVAVCGYSEPAYQEHYQVMHSNPLLYRDEGGRYDIDTIGGQSGSPVYFMREAGSEEVCHQVGIHKGYDRIANLNVCTLITEEVIARLREWMTVMGIAFRVSEPAEKKEAGLEQKVEEKSKDAEIAELRTQIEELAKERKEMRMELEDKEEELQQMRALL